MMTIMMMMMMMILIMLMMIIIILQLLLLVLLLLLIMTTDDSCYNSEDGPNDYSVKGSNFQETVVVETKSILGVTNIMQRSQLFICL